MSTEKCKLCNQDSTPWIYINGHICNDCYEKTKRLFIGNKLSWINIKDRLPEHEKDVLLLLEYDQFEEEDFNKWKENNYGLIVQGYISVNEAFYKSPHLSFKTETLSFKSFEIKVMSQFFPIPIEWVTHWMEIPMT